jgi:hypothetical protein
LLLGQAAPARHHRLLRRDPLTDQIGLTTGAYSSSCTPALATVSPGW